MKGIFTLAAALLSCLPLLGPAQTACAGEWTPETIAALKTQAETGNAEAQYSLDMRYDEGEGVPQDYAEARRWLEKAALQGHAKAQCSLGILYYKGQGVRQNYAEAHRWLEKAAAQGLAVAQYNLGAMYLNGDGVRQDKKTAKEWLGKACDNGCQSGCDEYRKLNEAGF
ncbi:MAG: sel1 repeat family protein [Desulfovibrio sp.]|nr:sel1 repeat family protein [Desulfovibrio sp.]